MAKTNFKQILLSDGGASEHIRVINGEKEL